jgi:hypothetical protein
MPSSKPDCAHALQRNAEIVTAFAAERSILCGPVRRANIAKYGHVSRISRQRASGILCSSDLLAEEERFELSVRFCRAKARRVRKLQIAKLYQRISHENRHQSFAISRVSIRHLFVSKRRTLGDSVARMVTLRGPSSLMGFAGDCLPTAQSESAKSIRRECSKKGK